MKTEPPALLHDSDPGLKDLEEGIADLRVVIGQPTQNDKPDEDATFTTKSRPSQLGFLLVILPSRDRGTSA